MWVSETHEPGAPGDEDGFESYYMVDSPTKVAVSTSLVEFRRVTPGQSLRIVEQLHWLQEAYLRRRARYRLVAILVEM